jgi:hypothetical protein
MCNYKVFVKRDIGRWGEWKTLNIKMVIYRNRLS